jgi:sugar phosphate isomerase/epimerase
MPLQLGISTLGFTPETIGDSFALAKEAACQSLLLDAQLTSDAPMFPCPPDQLKSLAAATPVWGARINLPAIATGELKNHPAYTQALAAAIAYCASAGIKRLALPLPPELHLSHGQAAQELDKLATLLQSHNIALVLVNDRFHAGYRTFWALFNAMDHHIGLLLDTGLATLAGDQPAQAISTLNTHLAGVILSDVEKGGPARYMPLGSGEARIHEYVRRLMGIGADLPVFVEFIPGSMDALGPAPTYLKAGIAQIALTIKKHADDIAAAKAPPVKAKPVPAAKPPVAATAATAAKPVPAKPPAPPAKPATPPTTAAEPKAPDSAPPTA